MFTGIIQNLGVLKEKKPQGNSLELFIQSDIEPKNLGIGQSIAVDGVCLTVENYDPVAQVFKATASTETLQKTYLAALNEGETLHLESPLTLNTLLGGHLVLGHVDGMAEVVQAGSDFKIQVPEEFLKYIALKGSLTLSGVSLTVSQIEGDQISFALIPETLKQSKLGSFKKGQKIHIEIDLIARTLEPLLKHLLK